MFLSAHFEHIATKWKDCLPVYLYTKKQQHICETKQVECLPFLLLLVRERRGKIDPRWRLQILFVATQLFTELQLPHIMLFPFSAICCIMLYDSLASVFSPSGFFFSFQECTLKVQDGKFKLQDLLVVPMQRVLKYHLLLKVSQFHQNPRYLVRRVKKVLPAPSPQSSWTRKKLMGGMF